MPELLFDLIQQFSDTLKTLSHGGRKTPSQVLERDMDRSQELAGFIVERMRNAFVFLLENLIQPA